jgi:arylsulfatase A
MMVVLRIHAATGILGQLIRGCLGFCLVTLQAAATEPKLVGRPPNIVLIVADDLGYGGLGCYGQRLVRTPRIDSLAREGLLFTDFYAGSCMCAPSRSVLVTGRHTGHARVRSNDPLQTLAAEDVTLATVLSRAGYVCGGFGKWGLGNVETPGAPARHGFDEWTGFIDQRRAHFHYQDWLWQGGRKTPLAGNDLAAGRRETYAADVIHAAALDFIRGNHSRPFFCFLASTIPHAELLVPEDSLAEYDGQFPETPYRGDHYASNPKPRATYAGMVTRFDRDVGRLIDLLDELGIAEDTIVMFTSDNGPIDAGGADPEFFRNAGPLRGLKFTLYEGGLRVPMIARWRGRITAGGVTKHVGGFEDLLPTFCELAAISAPPGIDGVSLVPTFLGEPGQKQRRSSYWEAGEPPAIAQAARVSSWKAVRPRADAPIELYDLAADIGETRNIAADHPRVVAAMEEIFAAAHVPRLEH